MQPSHFESLYPADSREKEVSKILEYVKTGNSCQIVGIPGVGRANLLGMLSYNHAVREKHLGENQKWVHFVLISFPEIRKRPLSDATKFIFLNLVDSLRERKMDEEYKAAQEIFKESLVGNDELVLFQGLKRTIDLLAIEKQLTIVFLFDRFEDYIPMLQPEFFANLRVIRNRAKYRFSVVFSLSRPLEDMLEPVLFADFYEFMNGHTIFLPIFDQAGLNFRISYLEKITEKKIEKDVLETILTFTAGHVKLTRLCIEILLGDPEIAKTSGNLAQFFLTHKTTRTALYEMWDALTPSEQNALCENTQPSPYLIETGLWHEGKVTIPLFADFIQEQKKLPEEKKDLQETISYDTETNEIKKGHFVLSERLTSAEFKLLSYFLAHPEKVIEREEIINTVWENAKSTAGVTDQALDQLIFRLRRKIEEDPNNPQHLQTIKGRGFRFIP